MAAGDFNLSFFFLLNQFFTVLFNQITSFDRISEAEKKNSLHSLVHSHWSQTNYFKTSSTAHTLNPAHVCKTMWVSETATYPEEKVEEKHQVFDALQSTLHVCEL